MRKILLGAIIAQSLAFSGANAASPAIASETAASYRCGGVGQLEQSEFKQEAAQHDAFVTFATPHGAYLAGIDFKVTTSDGREILQGHCDGPLMLLDVPRHGTYRIHAELDGK